VGLALTILTPATAAQGLHHASDVDLLAAARKRDAKAFSVLVARYHGLVYRVVWRMMNGQADAEDIAQEAFLKLWDNPGQVRDAAAVKAWLVRVAQNLVLDRARKNVTAVAEMPDVSDDRPDAEQQLGREWVATKVDKAVAQLPERQKLAITLVHFEHFAQAEAAHAMDLTLNAFESLLARARRTLKEQLTGDKQDMLAALAEEG
jgi:RNA polymerase sigma-70 factor, ECF subfamily